MVKFIIGGGRDKSAPTLINCWLHVFAKRLSEDIHDLAQGGIDPDCLNDGRHCVLCSLSNTAQIIQCFLDGGLVSLLAYTVETFKMFPFSYPVDVECWNLDLLVHGIVVDTHDGALMLVDLLLVAIC